MAAPPSYPPYQLPLLDARTGRVSKAWHLFFLSLVSAGNVAGAIAPGSITVEHLAPMPAPSLLGRGTPGVGPAEIISLGTGLTMTGTVLSATAGGSSGIEQLGYWTPITDGVTPIAELLFDAEGDCVVGFVPTPL
jgi:hypothetical protein